MPRKRKRYESDTKCAFQRRTRLQQLRNPGTLDEATSEDSNDSTNAVLVEMPAADVTSVSKTTLINIAHDQNTSKDQLSDNCKSAHCNKFELKDHCIDKCELIKNELTADSVSVSEGPLQNSCITVEESISVVKTKRGRGRPPKQKGFDYYALRI